jgi:multicomponent Na+:H+ antiporter subunit B
MRSMFLRLGVTSDVLAGLIALLSVFVLFRGHYAPGGGFAGGLLLVAAIAIPLLAGGVAQARRTLRVDPRTLVGVGLALVAIAACTGPVVGSELLAPMWGPYVPGIGPSGTLLLFDAGVYLVVSGTVLTVLFALVERR